MTYVETFGQYIRITVIFTDFVRISPSENGIFAHRKSRSGDFHLLWVTIQFFNGEFASKSMNITVILIYCPKVSM